MNGNDGRYDKSKPRAVTDQYSSRQYERHPVVAARAIMTDSGSTRTSTEPASWAPSTGRVPALHLHDGEQAQVSRDPADSVDDVTVASERSQTMQDSRRRGRWIPQCRYGSACDALQYGMQGGHGCRFYHSAREVFEASRTYGRCEDSAQWQTRDQHEISDDDPDDDEQEVVENSDGASASTNADGNDDMYEEHAQFPGSYEEAAQVSNKTEDKELSNEQNTSIDSDGDGSPVSNDDGYWVEDDQDAEEQPSVLPDPHRSRRWRPQCRYGNECHALQQGIGCKFHHTAKEMFNASRKDRRLEPHSEQWKPTAVSGKVTLSALIDEFLAKGIDRIDIEKKLGITLEAMLEAMRTATLEQRIAYGGFRIPRGAMQVNGSDGGTEEVTVLIDTQLARPSTWHTRA